MATETKTTGELAFTMAALARRSIGPAGTVLQVPEEDAPLLRSAFIARLAEAAMQILERE